MKQALTLALLVTLPASHLFAAEVPDPADAADVMDEKVDDLTARFTSDTKAIADAIEREANGIKQPDPDNDAELVLQVDCDVKSELTHFKIGIPEFRMKNRELSLNVPQTTMETREMKFDVPQITMVTKVIGRKPEVKVGWVMRRVGPVKTKVAKLVTKWTDIKADVPEVRMVTKSIKTDVPQFTRKRLTFVMGVPELSMRTRELKLDLPQFHCKSIKATAREAERQANELQAKAEAQTSERAARYQAELATVMVRKISGPFEEQRAKLVEQRESLVTQLTAAKTLYSESISGLTRQGMKNSDPQRIALQGQASEAEAAFNEAIKEINRSLENLAREEKAALESANTQVR